MAGDRRAYEADGHYVPSPADEEFEPYLLEGVVSERRIAELEAGVQPSEEELIAWLRSAVPPGLAR